MTRSQRKAQEAKAPEAHANKKHPNPHHDNAPNNQYQWDGNTRVSGEVTIKPPPDFLAEYNAAQKGQESHNSQQRLIGWLTLIAVSIYAAFAFWQACEIRRSNKISSDALQSVQRAIVSLQQIQSTQIVDANRPVQWQFLPIWSNDGNTAAKTMFMHSNRYSGAEDLPTNFAFPDIWDDAMRHTPPYESALGPKSVIGGGSALLVGPDQLAAMMAKPQGWFIYLWGWTTYRDVFYPHTPTHLTEFCLKLESFQANPMVTTPRPNFGACVAKPVCYDEDCKDYRERTK